MIGGHVYGCVHMRKHKSDNAGMWAWVGYVHPIRTGWTMRVYKRGRGHGGERRRTEAFNRLRKDKGLEWKHGATYNALL